ncbi:MAG: S8 family serine peptidase [Saprospiraceae bacterium]
MNTTLTPSNDLLIVRTHNGADPLPFLKASDTGSDTTLVEVDRFPEASVTIFRILAPRPRPIRDRIRQEILSNKPPQIDFVGKVMLRADTGVYQIYTGNIFICLHPNSCDQIERICSQYKLRVKTERSTALGFNPCAFFLEAIEGSGEVFRIAEALVLDPAVEIADPELVVKRKTFKPVKSTVHPLKKTEDQQLPVALAPTSDSPTPSWIAQRTRLPEAHKITKGKGTSIAVIDDGIDANHPAFDAQGMHADSQDFLGKLDDPADHQFPDEMHGTACASIAVSSDPQAPGVAPEARLIVARTKGLGSVLEAAAIHWAVEKGADIISCSWGPADGKPFDTSDDTPLPHPLPSATRLALQHAATKGRDGKGCLIVFAAGNGNEPVKPDQYANNPWVIAVGSSNKRNRRSAYSDFGEGLFCCFPSSDVRVVKGLRQTVDGYTVADRLHNPGYSEKDYFNAFGGTSAAAPAVAGVAALVLSIAPQLTRNQLVELLRDACFHPNHPKGTKTSELGYGILDAFEAVNLALQKSASPTINLPQSIKLDSPQNVEQRIANPTKNSNMSQAVSLHIGVNVVDDSAYPGYRVPQLYGCVADAEAWQAFAKTAYTTVDLHDQSATRDAVLSQLEAYAKTLTAGDICLITYAGHGSQIPAEKGTDEEDDFDETWLLYDGVLLDDEIDFAFSKFAAGVRIVLISDSCHSGTVSRNLILEAAPIASRNAGPGAVRERKVESAIARSNYDANKTKYQKLKAAAANRPATKAFVKLLPGCQDQQTAKEKNGRGVFSLSLIEVLKKRQGNKLDYDKAMSLVRDLVSSYDQLPAISDSGQRSASFDAQFPLDTDPSPFLNMSSPTNAGDHSNSSTGFGESGKGKQTDSAFNDEPSDEGMVFLVGTNAKELRFGDRARGSAERSQHVFDGRIHLQTRALGDAPFEAAYHIIDANPDADIAFVEADFTSTANVFVPPSNQEGDRGASALDELDFMAARPHPAEDAPNRETWHMSDEYSQLRSASYAVCPELKFGQVPQWRPGIPHVAMIDTGIISSYPVLPPNLDFDGARSFSKRGKDSVGSEDRGIMPEQQGHGTATANLVAGGLVSAENVPGHRFSGFVGAAPQMLITPLKISESVVLLRGSAFAAALRYATRTLRVDVVSMSMAGAPTNKMAKAVNEAYEAGVFIVSAAGNSWTKGAMGMLPKNIMYPARFARVVAAVGANYNKRPYLVDQEQFTRSSGGAVMQSCFGPSHLHSVMAAYTPNTMWAGDDWPKADGGLPVTMAGGGTSTATPQIAAAASLWLQLHGATLDRLINEHFPGEQWRRVEAVRHALFRGAEKSKYDAKYFGEGILRAYDALKFKPCVGRDNRPDQTGELPDTIAFDLKDLFKSEAADLGWTNMDEMVKLLLSFRKNRRSAEESNSTTSDKTMDAVLRTLAAEVNYLLYEVEALSSFRENPFPSGNINKMLATEILNLDEGVSDTLRLALSPYAEAVTPSLARQRNVELPEIASRQVSRDSRSAGKHIIVTGRGIAFDVVNTRNAAYDEIGDAFVEEFTVEITQDQTRAAGVQPNLNITLSPELGRTTTLVERYDEDGELIDIDWVTSAVSRSGTGDAPDGSSYSIPLNGVGARGARGGGRIVRKIINRVFKIFVKKRGSKLGKEVHRSYSCLPINPEARSARDRFGAPIAEGGLKTALGSGERTLLLLHGTYNTAAGSYDDLSGQSEFWMHAKARYQGRMFAFEMPSVVESVEDNLAKFKKLAVGRKPIDIIATSRGALVARALRQSGDFNIGNMAMIGGTNFGTPLANSGDMMRMVKQTTRLIKALGKPLGPALPAILKLIEMATKSILESPGIADQSTNSTWLSSLNAGYDFNRSDDLYVGSNFEPNRKLMRKLGDFVLDNSVFSGMTNDGVAPTMGALGMSSTTGSVRSDANSHFVEDDQINHFSYFQDDATTRRVMEHIGLTGQEQNRSRPADLALQN